MGQIKFVLKEIINQYASRPIFNISYFLSFWIFIHGKSRVILVTLAKLVTHFNITLPENGGSCSIESKEGRGTIVKIRFPQN